MEGLDRLTRSLADAAKMKEIFQYHGVALWGIHGGEISDIDIAIQGIMNKLYLTNLKAQLRRAGRGRALAGYIPAGLCYGYRVVRGKVDEHNRNINGIREIVPEEAEVILSIYENFAKGMIVRDIVRDLNERNIRAPGGNIWRDNAVLGSAARHEGILRREIYKGILVYNKTHKVIHPTTGKSKHVFNPRNEWIISEVPHMKIIEDELWDKVQDFIKIRAKNRPIIKGRAVRQSSRPLTYLVKCGVCGGHKTIANNNRYVCSMYRFKKNLCQNARGTKEELILKSLIEFLYETIKMEGDWIILFKDIARDKVERSRSYSQEKARICEQIARFEEAIFSGVNLKTTIDKLKNLECDLIEIDQKISQVKIKIPVESNEIRKSLKLIIDLIARDFHDKLMMNPIQALLKIVVNEIVLRPMLNKPNGETIDIRLSNDHWLEFYLKAKEIWPSEIIPNQKQN